MLEQVLLLVVTVAILGLSVGRRAANLRRLAQEEHPPRDSPLSQALREILGVSGGLYLVLVAMNQFVALNIPRTVEWQGVTFDPLAALAVLLAVLQPWLPLIRYRDGD
jgi:hypothetical protein